MASRDSLGQLSQQGAPGSAQTRWRTLARWTWLPVPLLLAATVALRAVNVQVSAEPRFLLPVLNLVFSTFVSLLVAYLAARSYLENGSAALLLLGCGMLAFAGASAISGLAVEAGQRNAAVVVHNPGLCFAGLCHVLSAVATFMPLPRGRPRRLGLRLAAAYSAVIAAMIVLAYAAVTDLMPDFLHADSEPTLLRQAVIGSAIAGFALSAALFGVIHQRAPTAFARWYAQGLALVAAGLLAVMLGAMGTPMNWLGRSGQYLGGVYMLAAVLATARERRAWGIPLERALREAHERAEWLARFPDENPNPVVRASGDGSVLYRNPAAAKLPGWTCEVGQPLPGLLLPLIRRAMAERQDAQQDLELGERFYSVSVMPFPAEGYVNIYGCDITEGKRAEQALADSQADLNRAQAVARTGSWRLDVRRNELLWSDETHRMFRVPKGTPLTYEAFLSAVHPDDRAYVDRKWMAALRGEPYDIEHRITVGDAVKWVRERAGMEFDEQGVLRGGFGTVQDITERKQAEEALRQARDELELRVRERTEELREAVDELQAEVGSRLAAEQQLQATNMELEQRAQQLARLASELTLAEQRERRRLAQVLHDHLQQLLVGAKFGLELLRRKAKGDQLQAVGQVNELLDQSIRASRSLTVEISPPILHEAGLAAGLEWLARWTHEKHGLAVELHADPAVATDREDVRIVIFEAVRELLFNVVKHAGVTQARVDLSRYDEDHLAVCVSDGGIGFNPEAILSSPGLAEGFGLLSLRERLSLLGGRMDIRSTPNQGSRFTVIAPMRSRGAAAAEEPGRTVQPAAAKPPGIPAAAREPARRIRLVVADDHAVVRQGLLSLLGEERDIEVVGDASNGREAIDAARRLQPDVVLMDLSMPEMNGIEATRILHAEFPDMRIIGLSMFEEPDRAAALLDAGAAAYVTKSGRTEALVAAIRGSVARQIPEPKVSSPAAAQMPSDPTLGADGHSTIPSI
jgi:signal transduction histidine kinase/ActR/RegA family two-component response regulator